MKEASELMKNMKNMPGMKNMDKMFKSMNIPTGGKMNLGAMQQKLNMNMKRLNQKDRMLKKLQQRKQNKQQYNPTKGEKTHEEIQKEIDAILKTFSIEGETIKKNKKPKKKNKNKKKKKNKNKKTNENL